MPAQWQRIINEDLGPAEPSTYGKHHLAQKRKRRLRRIQTPEPAAERGRVRQAIGILQRRCRRFPGTTLDKVAPQRLTAGDQAVMRVSGRKQRQEGNRLPATSADASPDLNPVMVFVMSLFAAATMANDRVQQTNRASANDLLCACLRPIGFQVALRCGK